MAVQKIIPANVEPIEDVKNYLLASSDYAQEIQSDIDPYVTRGKLNKASFRRKLDPIAKNAVKKENPLELVLKDIFRFNAQNPVIGSLMREIDFGKKDTLSKLLAKAPNPKEMKIIERLHRLRNFRNGSRLLPPLPSPPHSNCHDCHSHHFLLGNILATMEMTNLFLHLFSHHRLLFNQHDNFR